MSVAKASSQPESEEMEASYQRAEQEPIAEGAEHESIAEEGTEYGRITDAFDNSITNGNRDEKSRYHGPGYDDAFGDRNSHEPRR